MFSLGFALPDQILKAVSIKDVLNLNLCSVNLLLTDYNKVLEALVFPEVHIIYHI